MLRDLERILDSPDAEENATRDLGKELRMAAQSLWRSQFLYESDWGSKGAYDLIRRYQSYFENLFDALGYKVIVRPNEHLVGLLAIELPARQNMKLDESLMLLVLRLYYEEALKRFEISEAGEIEVASEALLAVYEERTRRSRPTIGRLHDLLSTFKSHGLVRYGEQESTRSFSLYLRPALPIVVGDEALASLEQFATASAKDDGRSDITSEETAA